MGLFYVSLKLNVFRKDHVAARACVIFLHNDQDVISKSNIKEGNCLSNL